MPLLSPASRVLAANNIWIGRSFVPGSDIYSTVIGELALTVLVIPTASVLLAASIWRWDLRAL